MSFIQRKRLGLALGGGGARGFAHVGVVQVLEEAGIRIDAVTGASAGAVAGLCVATGCGAKALTELAYRFAWRRVARPAWPRRGFISFTPLQRFLIGEFGDITFSDLQLPFACMGADPMTGREVVFREGRVAPCVAASAAIPPVVQPVEIDGRLYVDGGMLDNLPISATRSLGVDIVLAINLFGPLDHLPTGFFSYGWTILGHLVNQAGEDPAMADVLVQPQLTGMSMVTLAREALIQRGRAAMEEKVELLKEVLG